MARIGSADLIPDSTDFCCLQGQKHRSGMPPALLFFVRLQTIPARVMNICMKYFRICTMSVLASLAATAFAAPGDWPQFRGSNRDGISAEKGLLKEWPANGPRLVWKANGL